ncbi:hypothetical protein BC826DRAFT_1027138 [Russula brevipes]|nr:hypothetical protein BC826DRAFT_1027138 [Russula brevipes]
MSSNLAVLTFLLLSYGFVAAQVFDAPACGDSAWNWTTNTLGQSACKVMAYLQATCYGGSYTVYTLTPGNIYGGPSGIDIFNLCKCNTIVYSLMSACEACQEDPWETWSNYSDSCSKILPVATFPKPIPAGTRLPQWALLDVTQENTWNPNKSYAIRDATEIGPGTVLGPSGVSSVGPTSTSSSSSSSSGGSSNVGAIVGGVVGGIAAIIIACLAVFYWLRRRRSLRSPINDESGALSGASPVNNGSRVPSRVSAVNSASRAPPGASGDGLHASSIASQPHMAEVEQAPPDYATIAPSSRSGSPTAPAMLDNPNDSTPSFRHRGVLPIPEDPTQMPVAINKASGSTPAKTQASRSKSHRGLHIV